MLMMLPLASLLLVAGAAQAQANACDQLKAVLAARIDASGVRGYSLETVPAGTPVPAGAKIIGTCEAGANKILYRRWGGASPSPGVQADPSSQPAPASAISAMPAPVSRSNEVAPVAEPPPAQASEVATVRDADRAVTRQPQEMPPDKAAVASVPLSRQASEFMAKHWRWIGALFFALIAASIWVWHAHRSAYDEAGLPRGPRL